MKKRADLEIIPIPGADPATPHPLRDVGRGLGNLGLLVVECAAALLDLFRPPRTEASNPEPPAQPSTTPETSARPHPVEKAAPFPIND